MWQGMPSHRRREGAFKMERGRQRCSTQRTPFHQVTLTGLSLVPRVNIEIHLFSIFYKNCCWGHWSHVILYPLQHNSHDKSFWTFTAKKILLLKKEDVLLPTKQHGCYGIRFAFPVTRRLRVKPCLCAVSAFPGFLIKVCLYRPRKERKRLLMWVSSVTAGWCTGWFLVGRKHRIQKMVAVGFLSSANRGTGVQGYRGTPPTVAFWSTGEEFTTCNRCLRAAGLKL